MPQYSNLAPWVECPYCGRVGLHYMRPPNPDPPVVTVTAEEQDEIIQSTFDGRIAVRYIPVDKYDRDDERGFEVVRVCVFEECGRTWGVVA